MNVLQSPKKFSGKWFSPEDIAKINEMIAASPDTNRTALSRMVCEVFGWYKINGGLKKMSCRVAMLRMDNEGLIKLPPPKGTSKVLSHHIVNNARFLIFPWIKVPHLGSKVLSMAAKCLPMDWEGIYRYRPLLLETFVENERFNCTCYLAANWIRLGDTQGRGKKGSNSAVIPIKSIWVYPLDKNCKRKLCEAADTQN